MDNTSDAFLSGGLQFSRDDSGASNLPAGAATPKMDTKIKIFYTYIYLRENGLPYYVGKGSWGRIGSPFGRRLRVPPDSRIFIKEHRSEVEAFGAERALISYFGRADLGKGCLRNLTDGGEGASGFIRSMETRKKISISLKNRKCPWNKGVPHPKAQISMLGNKNGKGRASGFSASAETKDKMSAAQKKRWKTFSFSEDALRRMREKNKGHKRNVGRPCPLSRKVKIRESLKRYWAEKKGRAAWLGRARNT